MKMIRSFILTLVALFGLIVTSCINDDFTNSPSATLSFSTDTVSFGTVFTDLGTPTARLLVFNRNNKGVNISTIRFRDPDTPFTFNVDGVSGSAFSDVEIRANDSIYIFIECFIDEDSSADPRHVADQLEFVTNGVTQEVEVEAWAQNVKRLRGLKVETDLTLTPELPYVVFDSLTVERGATLRIDPGVQLLFHDKAYMRVSGRLDAAGSVEAPIHFRGDRIDNVLPGVSYDIMAGQWEGIRIAPESFDNRLAYVDMRSTSYGLRVDSCGTTDRPKLTLLNSWLHNSRSTVLSSVDAQVNAYGCCFSEAADAVVYLKGGLHDFRQCTITNYYLFSAISSANLTLRHAVPPTGDSAGADDEDGSPYMQATFDNCIIYGLGSPVSPADLTGSEVFVRNCLVKTEGENDENFIDCLWDEDPLFYTVRSDYYFNYHLQPDSPAFGKGNPDYVTPECLFDMDGVDRLTAPPDPGRPALGAYARYE